MRVCVCVWFGMRERKKEEKETILDKERGKKSVRRKREEKGEEAER